LTEVTFHQEVGDPLAGLLVYSDLEYSFRFEPASPIDLARRSSALGRASLSIGTLQVEVDAGTGTVLFVWGLHPRQRWRMGAATPERARSGVLRAERPGGFQRAVSTSVAEVGEWTTIHDADSGWVRTTCDPAATDDTQTLVASDTVLSLRSGRLCSIWLRPAFEDEVDEQAGRGGARAQS
jgi:hypothetical protein